MLVHIFSKVLEIKIIVYIIENINAHDKILLYLYTLHYFTYVTNLEKCFFLHRFFFQSM
jgi:hypothetical protein